MEDILWTLFIFLTALMWIDFMLSFVSVEFNKMIIKNLEEQIDRIEERKRNIKLFIRKMFKN